MINCCSSIDISVHNMDYSNVKTVNKIYTLLILILPISYIYASPIVSISIGELIIIAFMLILLIDSMSFRNLTFQRTGFFSYVIYSFLSTVVCCFIFACIDANFCILNSFKRMLRDAFYFSLILVFAPKYFDFYYGRRVIERIAFITGVFVIIQFFMYLFFKTYIYGVVPQLKTTISGGTTGAEIAEKYARTAAIDGYARGTGLFSEPAVVGQYMAVVLLLELFPSNGPTKHSKTVFYSIVMLFSFSLNAYVALMACWCLWIVYKNKGSRKRIESIFGVILFVLIVFFFAMQNQKISDVINRLIDLKKGGNANSSAAERVLRGIAFYFKMPILTQIFGSGFGNFLQFKELFNISTIYENAAEYLNTNAYILISSGLVGFLLYLYALIKSSLNKIILSKMLVVIILVLGLSSSLYSSPVYAIMLIFLITAPQKEGLNET